MLPSTEAIEPSIRMPSLAVPPVPISVMSAANAPPPVEDTVDPLCRSMPWAVAADELPVSRMLPLTEVTVAPLLSWTEAAPLLVPSSMIVAASAVVPVDEIVASAIRIPSSVLALPSSTILPSTEVISVPAESISIP